MIKNNKWKIIISSIIILLPIVFGLIFWQKLPDKMATHWNFEGEVDGWSSKTFAVFFLPLIVLALHWLCILGSLLDKRNKTQNKKIVDIIFATCPAVSIFCSVLTYAYALGKKIDVAVIAPILVGVMFIIIGNYLPKTSQNRTIGIKVKWTLQSEENWNATHRFCGKLWVIGGILFMFFPLLPTFAMAIAFIAFIVVLVAAPIIYSYLYYKNQKA